MHIRPKNEEPKHCEAHRQRPDGIGLGGRRGKHVDKRNWEKPQEKQKERKTEGKRVGEKRH